TSATASAARRSSSGRNARPTAYPGSPATGAGSGKPSTSRKNASGTWTSRPAPSPELGSAPAAPRWSRVARAVRPWDTMRWDRRPRTSTTNATPQESCSNVGSYRPWAAGMAEKSILSLPVVAVVMFWGNGTASAQGLSARGRKVAGVLSSRVAHATRLVATREGSQAVTDIFHAVGAGDPALVDALLRADRRLAYAHTDDGVSVVLWAMYVGQPRLATILAHAKRDLDVFEAAAVGATERLSVRWADAVRGAGWWPPDAYPPLHLAARFGSADAARRLVTAGADVDAVARNSMRITPLHSAATGAHPLCVRVLLDAGARPDARGQGGRAAPPAP